MARRVPRGGGQYLVGRPYTVAGRRYVPAENPSYSAVGMASWYGAAFHGRRTANGEVYDMASLSAAHPTMPLPSYARVTNLGNGYSVIVRVNDRGPYHAGRVMDVSSRVADILDMKAHGHGQGEGRLCRARADRRIGQLAVAGDPSHRRIASQYDRLSDRAGHGRAGPESQSIWSFFSGGGGRSPAAQAAGAASADRDRAPPRAASGA